MTVPDGLSHENQIAGGRLVRLPLINNLTDK